MHHLHGVRIGVFVAAVATVSSPLVVAWSLPEAAGVSLSTLVVSVLSMLAEFVLGVVELVGSEQVRKKNKGF